MTRLVLAALILLTAACDPGSSTHGAADLTADVGGGALDAGDGQPAAPDSVSADAPQAGPDAAAPDAATAPDLATPPDAAGSLDAAQPDGPLGPSHCPAAPPGASPGFGLGDQLAPRTFKNCDGEPVSLDAYCGADGLWLFFAHGWCPHCQKTSGFMEGVVSDYAAAGLVGVNVLMETGSGGVPTAASCREWRDNFGLKGAVTLYDDQGAAQALWDTPYTALSVFVDRDRVIVKKAHSDDEAQIRNVLNVMLGIVK
ncbi:MAG: redoxin domain-containing protein [Myxococcota bacterium]